MLSVAEYDVADITDTESVDHDITYMDSSCHFCFFVI